MADDSPLPLEERAPLEPQGSFEPAESAGTVGSPDFRQLHPALRKVWILSGLLIALVVAALAGVYEFIWRAEARSWPLPGFTLSVGVFVVMAAYGVMYASWRYQAWRYAIRPHDVLLHYGVLWRRRSCIPRLRIQHVDIESGPIDRAFGIVKLSLYTAGTNSAVGTIPGLLPEDAEALRETLLETERSDG